MQIKFNGNLINLIDAIWDREVFYMELVCPDNIDEFVSLSKKASVQSFDENLNFEGTPFSINEIYISENNERIKILKVHIWRL